MHPSSTIHDAIIVGAGPVGLLLACELRLAGCSTLVLEAALRSQSPLKELPFGLRGLTVPTIEGLDRRNLLEPLRARAAALDLTSAAHWARQRRRPGGHFAGIQFFHDQVDAGAWPHRTPRPVDTIAVDMASIEAVLADRAELLGVEIRRGCHVEALTQSESFVTVHAGSVSLRARWLIGCDGGRSTVRRAAGIGFAGTDPEFTGYSLQATLAGPHGLKPGRHRTSSGFYTFAAPGTIAAVDFDGGAFHRAAPVTREHAEAVLRRITESEVMVEAIELATTWTDRAFQATEYRKGHVLLAGDAAHVHSPLGGQGLNLGLGDAMNLGWKLAATIRGDAPEDLLDSYGRERQPVGAEVLDWSRAQVALMRPDRGSEALALILRDLIGTRDGATYVAGHLWAVDLRYDLGDDHPLVGRSAPDIRLPDGTRLNEHLRAGQGVLLDFEEHSSLRVLAGHLGRRLRHVAGDAADRPGVGALLVRPDGVIAWAGTLGPDMKGAAEAVSRWFGTPCEVPA